MLRSTSCIACVAAALLASSGGVAQTGRNWRMSQDPETKKYTIRYEVSGKTYAVSFLGLDQVQASWRLFVSRKDPWTMYSYAVRNLPSSPEMLGSVLFPYEDAMDTLGNALLVLTDADTLQIEEAHGRYCACVVTLNPGQKTARPCRFASALLPGVGIAILSGDQSPPKFPGVEELEDAEQGFDLFFSTQYKRKLVWMVVPKYKGSDFQDGGRAIRNLLDEWDLACRHGMVSSAEACRRGKALLGQVDSSKPETLQRGLTGFLDWLQKEKSIDPSLRDALLLDGSVALGR